MTEKENVKDINSEDKAETEAEDERSTKKRKGANEEEDEQTEAGATKEVGVQKDEPDVETQDRLHATFVRFCEEARMLGLVRARGGRTAKKADEVVKGIGLV